MNLGAQLEQVSQQVAQQVSICKLLLRGFLFEKTNMCIKRH